MIFIVVQGLIAISNALLMKKLDKFPKTSIKPKVSLLVPARNEEKTISKCVNSLINQDYDNLEIIILNDNSTDQTREILSKIKSKKLKVIEGKPLPDGWIGKSWACHQLSEVASGDLLLFTDADTEYKPETISCAVNAMNIEKTDLITAVHHNQVKSFGEKIIVTFPTYSIFTILPLSIAYLLKRSKALASGNGKFMMFDKEFYTIIGGHKAIREDIVEDVALARITKAHDGKWRILDATNLITSRMYCNFSEALQGFTKNYFALFGYNILLTLFIWFWIGVITYQPLAVVIGSLITSNYNLNFVYGLISIAITLFMWWLMSIKFRYPIELFLFYPETIGMAIFIGFRSMILTITNRVLWKGRRLKSVKMRWM
jgi:chlorobactene glucosyltransferase